MGRKKKDHEVNDNDMIGLQFTFLGSDYKTITGYAKVTINPDTGKPYYLSQIFARMLSRLAEDIRSGKKVRI